MLGSLKSSLKERKFLSNTTDKLFHQIIRLRHNEVYDTVIIGGGPVGTSVALHMALQGYSKHHKLVVIEKDFQYKYTSAMLSAGGIRQQFSVPENILMSKFSAEFLKNMELLAVDDTVPDIQFHENGYLFLANATNEHILQQNHTTQRACGVDWIDLLSSHQLKSQFPWLHSEDITLGSFSTKNEGYFDPWIFVHAMKHKAIDLGVEFRQAAVERFELQHENNINPSALSISKIHMRSRTSGAVEEFVIPGKVVNAAGCWSGQLVEMMKEHLTSSTKKKVHDLPVYPRKRCIFNVNCKVNSNPQLIPDTSEYSNPRSVPPVTTPLVIDSSGVYFRPEQNPGGFLMGVSPDTSKDPNYTSNDTLEHVEYAYFEDVIWPTIADRVPAFESLKMKSAWAGFYDYNTVDQVCYI